MKTIKKLFKSFVENKRFVFYQILKIFWLTSQKSQQACLNDIFAKIKLIVNQSFRQFQPSFSGLFTPYSKNPILFALLLFFRFADFGLTFHCLLILWLLFKHCLFVRNLTKQWKWYFQTSFCHIFVGSVSSPEKIFMVRFGVYFWKSATVHKNQCANLFKSLHCFCAAICRLFRQSFSVIPLFFCFIVFLFYYFFDI